MEEKHYTKGGLTVVWKPGVCKHTAICFRGLAGVFDPRRRPWIDLEQGTEEQIREQVKKCPSGALSLIEAPPAK
jgi:uncharacterized Fe-S cluster protein YjdI